MQMKLCRCQLVVFLVYGLCFVNGAVVGAPLTPEPLRLTLFPETLAKATGAQCLDGSPAGFYMRHGDPSRWLIFLEGGGLCIEAVDCIARADTELGSSKYWTPTTGDYMTTSVTANNPFAEYTQVFVPYCSGDTWLGKKSTPHLQLAGLQMSGHLILDTVVNTLINSTNMLSASNVVLSGTSAGGIGTFHHIDWFATKLAIASQMQGHAPPKVVGMPIAGIFFPKDYPVLYGSFYLGNDLPYDGVASSYVDFIEEPFLHPGCISTATAENRDSDWCFDISFMMESIVTPLFVMSNRFDAMQISAFGVCPPDECSPTAAASSTAGKFVRFYGDKLQETITQMSKTRPSTGFFVPADFDHDANFAKYLSTDYKAINGLNLRAAYEKWYAGLAVPGSASVQLVEPPCYYGGPCRGTPYSIGSRRLLVV